MQAVHGEFLSDDNTAHLATNAQRWIASMLEGSRNFGKPLDSVCQWKGKIENAGFVDVRQEVCKVSHISEFCEDPTLSIFLMLMPRYSSPLGLGRKIRK